MKAATPHNRRFQHLTAAQFKQRASERDIQSGIVALLRLVGVPHSITDAGMMVDRQGKVTGRAVFTDGWPDVTVSLPPSGRFLGLETKTATGKLRPSQIACHACLRASGAQVEVVHSVEELARVLIEAGIKHPALRQIIGEKKR